jgi:hypothetical protein
MISNISNQNTIQDFFYKMRKANHDYALNKLEFYGINFEEDTRISKEDTLLGRKVKKEEPNGNQSKIGDGAGEQNLMVDFKPPVRGGKNIYKEKLKQHLTQNGVDKCKLLGGCKFL